MSPEPVMVWRLLLLGALYTTLATTAVAQEAKPARERVEQMTIEEKQELRLKQESFVGLAEPEQQRIRKLHQELASSQDGERLRGVLERYHAWLSTLSSGERAELLSLPAEKRLERIKAMMQKQEDERFKKEVSDKLTADDRQAIMKWLLAFVEAHREEIVAALPADRRPPESERWPLMFAMLHGWRTGMQEMPRPQSEDLQQLIDALSPGAQATIKNETDQQKRLEVAQKWIRAAFESRRWRAPPPVSKEELRKFYVEQLTAAERERLEALSPEDMQHALQRVYYEHQFRGRGGFGPRRGDDAGPGPGRGNRDGNERRGENKKERRDGPRRGSD